MTESLGGRRALALGAAALVVFGMLGGGAARAALQVYEGFDYADATNLRTQTGGIGWNGAWTNTGAATETVTATGLTYQNLAVTGNKVLLAGQQNTGNGNNAFIFRDIATTFGTDDTTVWFSAIGQRLGDKQGDPLTYARVFSVAFFNGTTEQFSVGDLSNNPADVWSFHPTTAVADAVPSTVAIDVQSFLLMKIQYLAGTDNVSLWVNPNLAGGEAGLGAPSVSATDTDATFNRIRIQAGGSQTTNALLAASGLWDEIRVGDTFADVAPVGATPVIDADFDDSNLVDGRDFLFWQRGNGKASDAANSDGDANGDRKVDKDDLGFWKAHYGLPKATGAIGAVPEPTALALAATALAGAVTARRRARQCSRRRGVC
jgi:hypothetical protein